MAKRFIDTGFYKSPFVRSLQGASKALYSFIICDCTGAGIWMKDLEVASVYIGLPLNESNFAPFVDLLKAIEVAPGKFFFPDFIEHQYPTGLSEKNAAHKNFLEELLKYSVLEQCEDGNWKPLQRPSKGPMVMVMVKEEVMVTEKVTSVATIEKKEASLQKSGTYEDFIRIMSECTGRSFRGDSKSKKQFHARLRHGWTFDQMKAAIANAVADPYHRESGFKYITPEFMTREDKLDKFHAPPKTDGNRRIVRNTTVNDINREFEILKTLMGENNDPDTNGQQ